MGTYGDLQARIADELARSDLTSQIQKTVEAAIDYYAGTLFWFTEGEFTVNTVLGTASYALPAGLEEVDEATVTVSGNRYNMEPVSYDWIREHLLTTTLNGWPEKYAIFEEYIWTYPIPDGIYVMTFSGTKTIAVPATSGTSNEWTTEAEQLIRCRAKWDLYYHVIRNDKEADKMKKAEQEMYQKLMERTTARISSGRLKPTKF